MAKRRQIRQVFGTFGMDLRVRDRGGSFQARDEQRANHLETVAKMVGADLTDPEHSGS